MPSLLAPWATEFVWVSGVAEIAGGVGLLIPATRRAAGVALVALYVCVFPANVTMAWNHIAVDGVTWPPWMLYARLPFQAVLIALAVWTSQPSTVAT